jgi:hypothetical protein
LKGTLGAVLRHVDTPSRLFGLTAGHVFGAGIGSSSGDDVTFDFDSENASSINGRLIDWMPDFGSLPGPTAVDAGIAEVAADEFNELASRKSEWPVGTAWPFANDQLRLRTRGAEIAGDSMEIMSTWMCVAGDTAKSYQVIDGLAWRTQEATLGGDSGAPIWNNRDELVAIHAGAAPAGLPLNAVAVPIGPILKWARSDIVRRDEPLSRPALARGRSPVPLAVPPGLRPSSSEADVMARTMWGEARGEANPELGMGAVAHVILNRVDLHTWWGRSVIDVCQKPWQFSCWNLDNPNRRQLLAVNTSDARFRMALAISQDLIDVTPADRTRRDPTNGATHYYARRLIRKPAWAADRPPSASIGGHDFFKGIA